LCTFEIIAQHLCPIREWISITDPSDRSLLVTSKDFYNSLKGISNSKDIDILKCGIKVARLIVDTLLRLEGFEDAMELEGFYKFIGSEEKRDDASAMLATHSEFLRYREDFDDFVISYFRDCVGGLLGANESTGKKNTNQHVPIYCTQINILSSHQFSQLELNMQESCAGIYSNRENASLHRSMYLRHFPIISKVIPHLGSDIDLSIYGIHHIKSNMGSSSATSSSSSSMP